MDVVYRKSWYYLAILFLGVVVAFWPVSFYVFSVKNDALNYFLPVRRLVSESYFHHIIPFWSPYINLGYPLYGDMQSGVWNPIVQIFSLFGPYTLYTLHIETLLYIFLSGMGMFYLLRYFRIEPRTNMAISFAYMLCGFAIDSAQFLNWIAALSFLPLVFLFYYRTLKETKWTHAVYTAVFLYLMFTCAYPADFIITVYVLFFLFLWHLFSDGLKGLKKIELKNILKSHLLICVVFVLLSLPAIISFFQTLPFTERGTGATLRQALSNPLHPLLLSSWVAPLTIWKIPGVDVTDPLLRNSYFGILPFVFFIYALFIRGTHKLENFLKVGFVFFLVFSFGAIGLLRILAYYVLPMMDTFRHPANARMFTIFFSCMLAALALNNIIKQTINKKKFKYAFLTAAAFCVALLFGAAFTSNSVLFSSSPVLSHSATTGEKIKSLLDALGFIDIVIINMAIQVPLLFVLWKWRNKADKRQRLLLYSVLNCVIIAILLQPLTVVKKQSAASVQERINENVVNGYPLPDLQSSISENSSDGMKYFEEIGVLNLYNKKVGRVHYRISPSNLLSQNEFWLNDTLRDQVTKYPLVYRADTAVTISSGMFYSGDMKYVFVENRVIADSINHPKQTSAEIDITQFLPHRFSLNISTRQQAFFCLIQNYFPAWELTIDGVPATLHKTNSTFMGFFVPAGNHEIQITFNGRIIRYSWYLSTFVLACIIIISLSTSFRNRY